MPENREDILQDLGIRIRQKREELDLSLREAHEGTKIRTQFLEGIERETTANFPARSISGGSYEPISVISERKNSGRAFSPS